MTLDIAKLIRETLTGQPEPPRQLALFKVLGSVLKMKSMRTILAVTLSLAVALFVFGLIGRSDDRGSLIFGFVVLVFATTPFFYAHRLTRAIRNGHMILAVVESVEYSGPGSRDTLGAIENGIARGNWRLPEGPSIAFEVDEPWAKDLAVGSSVELLVASLRPSGIFPLGLRL